MVDKLSKTNCLPLQKLHRENKLSPLAEVTEKTKERTPVNLIKVTERNKDLM